MTHDHDHDHEKERPKAPICSPATSASADLESQLQAGEAAPPANETTKEGK